jgi:hypothetical protein
MMGQSYQPYSDEDMELPIVRYLSGPKDARYIFSEDGFSDDRSLWRILTSRSRVFAVGYYSSNIGFISRGIIYF